MSRYHLSLNDETVTGGGKNDTIFAFVDYDSSGIGWSSLNKGDVIDGGKGDDTLVVDIERLFQYVASKGEDDWVFLNATLDGKIKNIETLVLAGGYNLGDGDAPADPIDVSHISGLKEIWIAPASEYGQTDHSHEVSGMTLKNISGSQTLGVDGGGVFYTSVLTVDYRASAETANLALRDGAFSVFTINGANISHLSLTVDEGASLASVVTKHTAGAAKITDLTIDTAAGSQLFWLGGLTKALTSIIDGKTKSDTPNIGISSLEHVTLTGKGANIIDLTENKRNLTFTGGDGKDGVLVSMGNTNQKDAFDGGSGRDIFAINLIDAPATLKTLTIDKQSYQTINDIAKNFEVFGVVGDFMRTIVIDAAQVTMAHQFLVAQSAKISNLTDGDRVDFQPLGMPDDNGAHSALTLVHETSHGVMTGDGAIMLNGVDDTGLYGFIKNFEGATVLSTARLTSKSLYETVHASGAINLFVQGAQTWKDEKGVLHGVTIDAAHLAGNLTATGTALADIFIGGKGDDIMEGGKGDDTFGGGKGSDTVSYADATSGVHIDLGKAVQAHTGGNGRDHFTSIENVIGSAYNDVLIGTDGNNIFEGGKGNDRIDGNGGHDTASYQHAGAGVTIDLTLAGKQNTSGAGFDTLISIENVIGSKFDDVLTGNGQANTLSGGLGDDTISGGGGNDTILPGPEGNKVINGGAGNDTLSFAGQTTSAYADLSLTVSVENLIGSSFNDTLYGTTGVNRINGGAGNDYLYSQGGQDILIGGSGRDHLQGLGQGEHYFGGAGADSFVLGTAGSVTIADFKSGEGDKLVPDSGFGVTQVLDDQLLLAHSSAATTTDQRFIFDKDNSTLYFDADGSDITHSSVAIAVLTGVKTLTANDFSLV